MDQKLFKSVNNVNEQSFASERCIEVLLDDTTNKVSYKQNGKTITEEYDCKLHFDSKMACANAAINKFVNTFTKGGK